MGINSKLSVVFLLIITIQDSKSSSDKAPSASKDTTCTRAYNNRAHRANISYINELIKQFETAGKAEIVDDKFGAGEGSGSGDVGGGSGASAIAGTSAVIASASADGRANNTRKRKGEVLEGLVFAPKPRPDTEAKRAARKEAKIAERIAAQQRLRELAQQQAAKLHEDAMKAKSSS